MAKVVYSPYSFASIMRAIFELLYEEIEDQAGADARRKLHQQHVKLRQKIQAAYESQFPDCKEEHAPPLALADIALVALHRIEKGAEVADVLKISKGKLLKLARKRLVNGASGVQ